MRPRSIRIQNAAPTPRATQNTLPGCKSTCLLQGRTWRVGEVGSEVMTRDEDKNKLVSGIILSAIYITTVTTPHPIRALSKCKVHILLSPATVLLNYYCVWSVIRLVDEFMCQLIVLK